MTIARRGRIHRATSLHRGRGAGAVVASGAIAVLALFVAPVPARAQTELQRQIVESQRRLAEIQAERASLQREMNELQGRVHEVSAEIRNVERQLGASRTVVAELNFQLDATMKRVDETTLELSQTRDRLRQRQELLALRVRDVYKRGPLHSVRVLLSAESFSDLLNRYKYLRLIADYDRSLIENISELASALTAQDEQLKQQALQLERLRATKLTEVTRLQRLETQRQRTLRTYQTREQQARGRLDQLAESERELGTLVTTLERRRREAERRAEVAGAAVEESTLSTGNLGTLEWPVDGRIVYRFGRERRPNGTVLRWNGLGIAADPGSPVRAVQAGTVVLAGRFEGYGPSVIVSHGGGFYTLYLYLEEVRVREGDRLAAGDILGTVGGVDTPEGPHIEFQVRAPTGGGSPVALDPLQWLRQPSAP